MFTYNKSLGIVKKGILRIIMFRGGKGMDNKINFLENGDYKFVMELFNEKMPILKSCKTFSEQYARFFDVMEDIEDTLNEKQKEKFNEFVTLIYDIEEYYFAFVYSLGVKYGQDLEKI